MSRLDDALRGLPREQQEAIRAAVRDARAEARTEARSEVIRATGGGYVPSKGAFRGQRFDDRADYERTRRRSQKLEQEWGVPRQLLRSKQSVNVALTLGGPVRWMPKGLRGAEAREWKRANLPSRRVMQRLARLNGARVDTTWRLFFGYGEG